MTTEYHPLDEGHFSYLAVSGEVCEVKIGTNAVTFNLQTAEALVDALQGYIQDRRLMQVEYLDDHREAAAFFQFIQAKKES